MELADLDAMEQTKRPGSVRRAHHRLRAPAAVAGTPLDGPARDKEAKEAADGSDPIGEMGDRSISCKLHAIQP
jgi:hypothetical protein